MPDPRVGDAGEPTPAGRSQRLADGWEQAILTDLAVEFPPAGRTGKKFVAHLPWAINYFEAAVSTSGPTSHRRYRWMVRVGNEGPDGTPRDPAPSTVDVRHWILRRIYRVAAALGAQIDPLTAAGEKPHRSREDLKPAVSIRPLTEDELLLACAHADSAPTPTKAAIAFALSLAGGSADEIHAVRTKDLNLQQATVTFTGQRARTCALDPWELTC